MVEQMLTQPSPRRGMAMSPITKYWVKRALATLRISTSMDSPAITSMGACLSHLKKRGFRPKTILDVGAADGTIELYRGFPDCRIIAIEPVTEFTHALKRLQKRYALDHIAAAASDGAGSSTIVVTPSHHGSFLKFLKRANSTAAGSDEREIPTVMLDDITCRVGTPPYLLKIDVQGAEHEVLRGAHTTLRDVEVAIIECSIFRFRPHQPILSETIELMAGLNFAVYGLADLRKRPLDGALGQLDVIFVNQRSKLWEDHRYAEPEQAERYFRSSLTRLKNHLA